MRNLAPVFWHEGIFLRPHHLQQQERVQMDRLSASLEELHPYGWGVATLEIERSALKAQMIEISRAKVVFPDGGLMAVPENAEIEPRSFGDYFPPAAMPLDVFLGLPRLRPNAPNYAETYARSTD